MYSNTVANQVSNTLIKANCRSRDLDIRDLDIKDYCAAGTLVVQDVDLLGADVIKVYRPDNPDRPTICRRGVISDAVPAVPGWTFAVDTLLRCKPR